MWNVLVCDDNRNINEELQRIITEYEDMELRVRTYTMDATLIGDIEEGLIYPDIIFMDIKLQRSNGIVAAKKILDLLPFCQIIFISGYDEYYLDVYEVDHIYFIKKPLREKTVKKAIARAISKLEQGRDEIFSFTNHGKTIVLPLNRILYFEKEKRKIFIYTNDGQVYEYYGKLDELTKQLTSSFVRCHNSYVVNLSKVNALQKDRFLLSNNVDIPVSRLYYKETRERFTDYIERTIKEQVIT